MNKPVTIRELGVVAEQVVAGDDGAEIRRRLDALGVSNREWYARTGIDRKTLNRAIENNEKVRLSTHQAIVDWLDRLEREKAGPVDNSDVMEVEVIADFGHVIVRAPVRAGKELEEMVVAVSRSLSQELRAEGSRP